MPVAGPTNVEGGGFGDAVGSAWSNAPLNRQQVKLLSLVWTVTGLAGIFVALRFYSKVSRRKRLWWDDFFLVLALLILVAVGIICNITVHYGFGLHHYEVNLIALPECILLGCIIGTLTIVGAIWSKTSWALTLLRLTDGWYRAFIWCAIVFVNVFMGIGALLIWIGCTPIEKSWNPFVEGRCWATEFFCICGIVGGVFSGAMDVALSLIPWKLLMGMRMRKKEKIGVAVAMSMGIFAGAAAFVKAAYIPLLYDIDGSYSSVNLVIWSCVEIGWCVIAASIPMLRPLFIRGPGGDLPIRRHGRRRPTLFPDGESQAQLPLPFLRMPGRNSSAGSVASGGGGGTGGAGRGTSRGGASSFAVMTNRSSTLVPGSISDATHTWQKSTATTATITTASTMSTASTDKQHGHEPHDEDDDDARDRVASSVSSTASSGQQRSSRASDDRAPHPLASSLAPPLTPTTPTTPTSSHKRVASISRFREEEVDAPTAAAAPAPPPLPTSPPPPPVSQQQQQPLLQQPPTPGSAAGPRPGSSSRVHFRNVDFTMMGSAGSMEQDRCPRER